MGVERVNIRDVMLASALSKGNLAIIDRICKTPLEKVLALNLSGGAILPSEYQRVEYIASADGGQYLYLGLTDTNGYSAILNYQIDGTLPDNSDEIRICGGVTASPAKQNLAFSVASKKLLLLSGGEQIEGATATTDRTQTSIFGIAGENVKIDDAEGSTVQSASVSPVSIALFGTLGDDGNLLAHASNALKIYNAKFADSTGTLVRNMIPCYRISDSEIGMWDMVSNGFNVWDEVWSEGGINSSNGQPVEATGNIRSDNYIPVDPSTEYYQTVFGTTKRIRVFFYKENNGFISYAEPSAGSTFTTPSNCAFIKFVTRDSYGGTYNNNICINVSSSRNGTYYPFSFYTNKGSGSFTKGGDV